MYQMIPGIYQGGLIMWSVPNFPRDKHLWDTAETFLSDAKENLKTESSHADIPMRFIQGEMIHYNIKDATKSQEAVLNKVFEKIRAWMVWDVHVLAPTGISAFNVLGQKLHRFSVID
jgi:hypothetical protein